MDQHLDTILSTVVKWAGDAIELAGKDARLIYVNASFEKMTGFSSKEVIGKTPAQFLRSTRQNPQIYDEMWLSVSSGKPWSGQIFRKCKNGEDRLFEITVAPVLNEQKAITNFVAISRDVTERILEEKRKLELTEQVAFLQKQESLGLMAGRFAHDFNNLLTIIGGSMDLVRHEVPQASQTYFSDAFSAIHRAGDLIQQMLLFSGGKKPEKQELDPTALIESMQPLFKVPVGKNIRISYNMIHDGPKIKGDQTQFGQVLLNLITNASEAIGDNLGTITLKTDVYEMNTTAASKGFHNNNLPQGSYLAVTVKDSGCGISKEALSRIFDPFYTSKQLGHGLGLSSVMGIVKSHGGDIRVKSSQGVGTEFTVLFPAIFQEEECKPMLDPQNKKAKTLVLVVDDDRLIRRMLTASLNRLSMETIEAEDGLHGWECYQENAEKIDLVIFDQMMPRMKGMEMLALIRDKNPRQKTILISGFRGKHPSEWETGHKPDIFVAKPFSPQELMSTVNNLLARDQMVI